MSIYVRNRVEGGTYFFTVTLLDRHCSLLVDEISGLRAAVASVRPLMPFHVNAWVVLPEHMHCVWTLPAGDADYSGRWMRIKARFSRGIVRPEFVSASRRRHGERAVWARRFWEHTVRDEADYARCVDYTHFNPVKHGYVEHAADWPYSSFRRCVARGVYPADWDKAGVVRARGD